MDGVGGTAAYQMLPPLADDDLARLRASIAKDGVVQPIIVDEDGEVIDGHHRKAIAAELGVDCPELVEIGKSEAEKRLLAITLNVARRHLTTEQKVLLGMQVEGAVRAEVATRRRERMAHAKSPTYVGDLAGRQELRERTTAARVGSAIGVSDATYARTKRVIEDAKGVAPEMVEEAAAGRANVTDIRRVVERRRAEQGAAAGAATVPPPPLRRLVGQIHDFTSRLRTLRAQHGADGLARSAEADQLADQLDRLSREMAEFAAALRGAAGRNGGDGHGRHAG